MVGTITKGVSEMKGKRFDPEFKKDIAKLYLSGERTGASLAEELGIHPNTVYKWAEQYSDDPEQAFQGPANSSPMRTSCVRLNVKLSNWKMRSPF